MAMRFLSSRCRAWILLAAGLVLAPGCAKNDVRFHPVSGRILMAGKPLTGVPQGGVTLWADAARGNETLHQPVGAIAADGSYEVTTIGKKGAPPGWYKVVVAAYANRPEEGPVTPRLLLHGRYANVDTTDLRLEVVPDPPANAYDLNVVGHAKSTASSR
jgi:hypothetical protein